MDLDIETIMDWFENNKDWFLIPVLISTGLVLIGFILMIVTGGDTPFFFKLLFILLLFSSPIMGFMLGDVVDPYLKPLFSKALSFINKT